MSSFLTPRINGTVLDQFVGQIVCVVGKVVSHDEGAQESVIEMSDGKELTIKNVQGTLTSQYVEIIGHLDEDRKLQEFKTADFGDSFDLEAYHKTIQLMTGKFSYLFYGANE